METLIAGFIFTLGLVIGSFLNVVIYRYNTGATVAGRSMCLSCGAQLTWKDLIPVASFIVQNGKCRYCGARISWQYPLVELFTGSLFIAAYYSFGLSLVLLYAFVQLGILVVITIYDIRHKIIPNGFVYTFAALALARVGVEMLLAGTWQGFEYQLLAGPLLAAPFALLWYFSKGEWMGLGDAKLALGIGWLLGLANGYLALILAFWTGAMIGLTLLGVGRIRQLSLGSKKVTMKSEIPFGPFLILGTLLMFLAPEVIGGWLDIVIFWTP